MADGESVPVPLAVRTSDLKVRALSAIVMLVVAGGALWAGGWLWTTLIVVAGVGIFVEWFRLVVAFTEHSIATVLWLAAGVAYIGIAVLILVGLRGENLATILLLVSAVVATDIGAYFAGRIIGGPKMAPSISPSKTWAGLYGGMAASALVFISYSMWLAEFRGHATLLGDNILQWLFFGAVIAIIAQAGDFFESWMKRKAGVKDSGRILPGHGGIFDRCDGLIAVFSVGTLLSLLSQIG